MRNGETHRNVCTQTKRTHERKAPSLALPLGELAKISDFRLRGQQRCMLWAGKKALSAQCAHWAPLPEGEARAACRRCQWRDCYPGGKPTPLGVTRFVTAQQVGERRRTFRRAGACPRRLCWCASAPTKFPRTKTFPLGGRWHGEAVTDEGRSVKTTASAKKSHVSTPHQSKIKDFCQLPPRGKPRPSPFGRGKGR